MGRLIRARSIFERFRAIADDCGGALLVDMAHFAGLVAGEVHASPIPHADVVTTTTYKSLRGARGGLILTNDEALALKLDSAMFPGAAGEPPAPRPSRRKPYALGEALRPEFKMYARRVLENARALAETLVAGGLTVVTGGTDTPLMLVDLRPLELTGDVASESLERAGLTANKKCHSVRSDAAGCDLGLAPWCVGGDHPGLRKRRNSRSSARPSSTSLEGLRAAPAGNDTVETGALARINALSQAFPDLRTLRDQDSA